MIWEDFDFPFQDITVPQDPVWRQKSSVLLPSTAPQGAPCPRTVQPVPTQTTMVPQPALSAQKVSVNWGLIVSASCTSIKISHIWIPHYDFHDIWQDSTVCRLWPSREMLLPPRRPVPRATTVPTELDTTGSHVQLELTAMLQASARTLSVLHAPEATTVKVRNPHMAVW